MNKAIKSEFKIEEIDYITNDGSAYWKEEICRNNHADYGEITVIQIDGRNYACFKGDVVVVKGNKIVDVIPEEEFSGVNYIKCGSIK